MIDDVLGDPRPPSRRALAGRVGAAGAGGGGRGADLRHGRLGDRRRPRRRGARRSLHEPLLTVRGYGLPSWATPEWTVLCSSYSGETEETLACFGRRRGARRAADRRQHRRRPDRAGARREACRWSACRACCRRRALAVAYMFAVAAEVAALSGIAPRIHTEIDAAAAHLERSRDGLQRPGGSDRRRSSPAPCPVVYGADLTVPVARRWKTQVNENAKRPAFYAELPEADHNEIAGWAGAGGTALRRLPRGLRPAPARAPALRADRRGGGRDRGAGGAGRDRGVDPHGAAALGGDARRPRLAGPRRGCAASTRSRSRRSRTSRTRSAAPTKRMSY